MSSWTTKSVPTEREAHIRLLRKRETDRLAAKRYRLRQKGIAVPRRHRNCDENDEPTFPPTINPNFTGRELNPLPKRYEWDRT